MIDADARVAKIHKTGYWRVNIRPTRFAGKLIPLLSDCWRIVETSKVVLRGWDYPHVDEEEKANGQDWIQSGIDWQEYGHVELWRLHQSGQFVHHLACTEDYHELPWSSSEGKPERYLLYVSALYILTEIFEFASRLATKEVLLPAAYVSITLGNMARRELSYWHFNESLFHHRGYVSEIDEIKLEDTYSPETLLARSPELALEAALHLYERFGWMNAPRQWLAERQRMLLERRL